MQIPSWARRNKKLLAIVLIVSVWFGAAKEIGFVMFIQEESLQMLTFAMWQAKSEATKKAVLSVYRKELDAAWTLTYCIGWINPVAFWVYREFWQACEQFYWAAAGGGG